jgi:hypothetical protein
VKRGISARFCRFFAASAINEAVAARLLHRLCSQVSGKDGISRELKSLQKFLSS